MHYTNQNTQIYVYAMPVLDSRMYIIINDKNNKEALIIDPLRDPEALAVIRQLNYATVLLTHSHYDHISGVNWLREQLNCTLLCSEICAEHIKDSHKNLSAFSSALILDKTEEEQAQCMSFFDMDYTCQADKTFDRETSFTFGSYQVEIIHTPGHSECSQCIRLFTDKKGLTPELIFTGDSLVNGHDIITRLPGGSKRDYRAVTKPYLDSLAPDTLIMPGHGEWGTKAMLSHSSDTIS
ncbi:MAG: MBL fold metallo-hydrolase [Lachnospiraceae bacterium]|nr:MBL fold metallo-hydrolase [Lachnospiraceae bacterium]